MENSPTEKMEQQETNGETEKLINRVLEDEQNMAQLAKMLEHEKIVMMDQKGLLHSDWKVREMYQDPETQSHHIVLWSQEGQQEMDLTLAQFAKQRLHAQLRDQ